MRIQKNRQFYRYNNILFVIGVYRMKDNSQKILDIRSSITFKFSLECKKNIYV